MSKWFIWCNNCGDFVGRELTTDEAPVEYTQHRAETNHSDLIIRKEIYAG